jgi:hypothetical protein
MLRKGSYFPGFLEPRRTAEKALAAVIQEARNPRPPGIDTMRSQYNRLTRHHYKSKTATDESLV